MRIFLTGATGFVGSHLVKRLVDTGHEPVCLIRASGNPDRLSDSATLVRGDVTDKASVVTGMRGCDWVIHLANLYSFWERDHSHFRRVNVDGTRHVMEAAIECGVIKVAHISSVVVYGRPHSLPFSEETPAGPVLFSEYARTKQEGDALAWFLHKEKRLPLVMLYPAAVIGPGDLKASGRYVVDFLNRRLPARVYDRSIITWVHVRDVVEAVVRALEKKNNIGERYLVCGERMTNREFTRLVTDISGVNAPRWQLPRPLVTPSADLLTALAVLTRRPPSWGMSVDQMRTLGEGIEADGGKASRDLGVAYTPMRVALEEAVEWYRQEGKAPPRNM